MVRPTNTQPEAKTNGEDLVKPSNATTKLSLSDQPSLKSDNVSPTKHSINVVAVENNHSNNDGSNVIVNGKNSDIPTITTTATVTENSVDSLKNEDVVSNDTNKDEKNTSINNDNEQQVSSPSSSAETKESQPLKKIPIPAPIPSVNFWEVRREAMQNARKVPVTTISSITSDFHPSNVVASNNKSNNIEKQCKEPLIDNNVNQESLDDSKKFLKKPITKTITTITKHKLPSIIPPLEDQSSWPAPGEEKWLPYTPITITHSTPLPNHGQRHRRRSEDAVSHTSTRELSSSQQNGNSNPRRRANLSHNGREQYGRRYSHSDNGQYVHHTNNVPFRGGRRGLGSRGRSYHGTRVLPQSATFSYPTGWPHQFGNFYAVKMPSYVYDVELLKYHILQQVEYYFSVENLCKDIYLRSNMDAYGFVDISLLANFNRVKLLTLDEKLVREALLNSYVIEVSNDKARKRDGWEMWLLPNQPQQNISEQTLAESTYSDESLALEEYNREYENINSDSEATNHVKRESQGLKQEQGEEHDKQEVEIESTAETFPTMTTINELAWIDVKLLHLIILFTIRNSSSATPSLVHPAMASGSTRSAPFVMLSDAKGTGKVSITLRKTRNSLACLSQKLIIAVQALFLPGTSQISSHLPS
ncbi:5299_t:CDS:10 [Ambispora gerdemannii]|uniref:5299_t:CDS:1 n=1 Tax=Ambispora gerdemannii TaxID=144530 RepID=A0A9N8UVR9_9GLOM|nr:5299_t:CDS:10 [Ambispora gerdemannii]